MKKNKKIAYVTDAIWPYNKGGKEKRLYDVSTRLAKKGYDIHIYTMKWWEGKNIRHENGITLHAISPLLPLYSGKRRSVREGLIFGVLCLCLIFEDWDVIDVDQMPFFPLFSVKLACLFKGRKMTATWHEVWGRKYWIRYMGLLGYISYLVERLSLLLPDRIISVSKNTTQKLRYETRVKRPTVTIPDGVDTKSIQKVKPSSIQSDVIFAGRLLSHKNIDILIKSVSILKETRPQIRCLIIGDGPEREPLEFLVRELNLEKNVSFFGFLESHNRVLSLIKSSKVFVLPSDREGFGIAVVEANACGKPVVTIRHSDNAAKDLIKDGENGLVCDMSEYKIADGIKKILKEDVSKIKNVCIRNAYKYNWENSIEKIISIY